MKYFSILFLCFVLFSCKNKSKPEVAPTDDSSLTSERNLDWILGSWHRTNDDEGQITYEIWNKNSESNYDGFSYTLQQNDTTFQEIMKITKSGDTWELNVKAPEDTVYTSFKMTNHEPNQFIFENPDVDFPSKINYWKENEKMNAIISNAEMEMLFEFEKN